MAGVPILFVENDAVMARVFTVLLERWGYEVELARNAGEALSALGQRRPAAILTDVELPGLDGLQLTRSIKANPTTRTIPIIAIHSGDRAAEEAVFAAGCTGAISRRVDTHRLLALLRVMAPVGQR